MWILWRKYHKKWTKTPVSWFAIFAELISLKLKQLNQFSKFLHEILGIDSKSHFHLILGGDCWFRPPKKFGGQILNFAGQICDAVLAMFRGFGQIWPNWDQIWAWLPRGHRWAVGVRDPPKIWVTSPSLLINCYLDNKFHKKNTPLIKIETTQSVFKIFAWNFGNRLKIAFPPYCGSRLLI